MSLSVKFVAPHWDMAATDAHATELEKMEDYFYSAKASGLDADEIAEDLMDQWPKFKFIRVTENTNGIVWIEIDPDQDD